MPRTVYEKVWEKHCVETTEIEDMIYIDLHILHEVNTSPCFRKLESNYNKVRCPELTLATADHNVSTNVESELRYDDIRNHNIDELKKNCNKYQINFKNSGDTNHGISHVIAPELGLILPGNTIACCDSHTTTHGAFAALGFGIGTSQVEHVLVTQTLRAMKLKTYKIELINYLAPYVTVKDLALYIINKIGTSGGFGHVIEYTGSAISSLSMEERMTLCNMSAEAGAGAVIIGVDNKTIKYLTSIYEPVLGEELKEYIKEWTSFVSDKDAVYDKQLSIDASNICNRVTWGINPAQSITFDDRVPVLNKSENEHERDEIIRAYSYMNLKGGEKLEDILITNAFIGSCTNGRIEDLRRAASILEGQKVNAKVKLLVVPGSMNVLEQAIKERLDIIFKNAGANFMYLSGCSICVGLNEDSLSSGDRCISSSNRNFEGRQGVGVMTHIASPEIVAYSSIAGYITNHL